MKYDFTTIMDRRGRDALAVDDPGAPGRMVGGPREGFSLIPMWVADMNFATAPTILDAMAERVKHPAFGYFHASDAYYESIIRWQESRNQAVGLTKEAIGYENGVLGCVVAAADAFCSAGDSILAHSPTYIGFTHCLENNGYHIVLSELARDADGVWRMDYEDMAARIKEHSIHTVLLCSPHNPTGRVWERQELERAMEIFRENDCVVISDEIWSDLLLNGNRHLPTQSVSEDARNRTIAIYAPSKTFNLAGLVGAYHIVYNKYLRDRLRKQSSLSHYNSQNVLSMHALIGAYQPEGAEWVDELRQVLSENVNYAYEYIREHFAGVELSKPEGAYMLFLDCARWCEAHGKTLDELLKAGWDAGVIWQDGRPFHGPSSIRVNLALPHSLVVEAMGRLKDYVFV